MGMSRSDINRLYNQQKYMKRICDTKINRENPEENKWFIGPKDHRRIVHLEVKT